MFTNCYSNFKEHLALHRHSWKRPKSPTRRPVEFLFTKNKSVGLVFSKGDFFWDGNLDRMSLTGLCLVSDEQSLAAWMIIFPILNDEQRVATRRGWNTSQLNIWFFANHFVWWVLLYLILLGYHYLKIYIASMVEFISTCWVWMYTLNYPRYKMCTYHEAPYNLS